MITGASEGIGKSYALELAKAGYNLKICARSVDKLDKVAEEARSLNPDIQIQVVQFDVMNAQPKNYESLFTESQPTTIVVNNAGIMRNRFFLKTDPAHLEAMIKTNVHPYIYMAKYATLHFQSNKDKHQHQNAILFTSSMAACCAMANMAVYAGTKMHNLAFSNCYAQAIKRSSSTRELIEVQSLHPAGVSTNLTKFKEVGGEVVTADDCVRGSITDLGSNSRKVFGALVHAAMGHTIPLIAWSPHVNKYTGKMRAKDPNSFI